MTFTQLGRTALVALALAAACTGVYALERQHAAVAQAPGDDDDNAAPKLAPPPNVAVARVEPGSLIITLTQRGSLEPERAADVYSRIEGRTTIIMLLPEGTRVTKGQVVCDLDPAELKDQLTNQRIEVGNARAIHHRARRDRVTAEIALTEYVDGTFRNALLSAACDIKLNEQAIAEADERLKRTRAARERLETLLAGQGGPKAAADLVAQLDLEDRIASAQRALDRERTALELAQARRETLEKYTRVKTTNQLQSDIDIAHSEELAAQQAWELQLNKQRKLERQIALCTLRAPIDGILSYAARPSRPGTEPVPAIEEGVSVRERQRIFRVIDLNEPMRVVSPILEDLVRRFKVGQKAVVKVDAFPNETFAGVVQRISPLADSAAFHSQKLRLYPAEIRLSERFGGLRPGMTAEARIEVDTLENVLTVPVNAVVSVGTRPHVAVKTPGGEFEWRAVTLGAATGDRVEVKSGLKAGEDVVVDPRPIAGAPRNGEQSTAPLERDPPR